MARKTKAEKDAEAKAARVKLAQEVDAYEKSIVRAMTFEELVTATVEMLTKWTGLGVIVERSRDAHAEIHLTTLGGGIRLGYTTVTQYSNGTYGVAGTSAGCFMANGSDNDIRNVLHDAFEELEKRANAPKQFEQSGAV